MNKNQETNERKVGRIVGYSHCATPILRLIPIGESSAEQFDIVDSMTREERNARRVALGIKRPWPR